MRVDLCGAEQKRLASAPAQDSFLQFFSLVLRGARLVRPRHETVTRGDSARKRLWL